MSSVNDTGYGANEPDAGDIDHLRSQTLGSLSRLKLLFDLIF